MKMTKKEIEKLDKACKALDISTGTEESIFSDSSFDNRKNVIGVDGKYKKFENGKIISGNNAFLQKYQILFLETYLTGDDDYNVKKVCKYLGLDSRKIRRELNMNGSAFNLAFRHAEDLVLKGLDFSKTKKILEIESRKQKLIDQANSCIDNKKAYTDIHKLILDHDKLLVSMIDGHLAERKTNISNKTIKITAKVDLTKPIDEFNDIDHEEIN